MKCEFCSSQVADGATSCQSCGGPVTRRPAWAAPVMPAPHTAHAAVPVAPARPWWQGWKGVLLAMLLIGVVGNILDPGGVERRRQELEARQAVAVQAAPSESPSPSPTPEWVKSSVPHARPTPRNSEVVQSLTVLDVDIEADANKDQFKHAVGTVWNNTNRTWRYVQVELNVYDDHGNQLGSTMANVNNLEAGGKWRFDAVILQDDAASVKVKAVTRW